MSNNGVDLALQLINTAGVVGVLVFFVYAFYKGHIVSKPTLDNIIASTVRHVLRELRADGMEQGASNPGKKVEPDDRRTGP
jgi:hypothetical protein